MTCVFDDAHSPCIDAADMEPVWCGVAWCGVVFRLRFRCIEPEEARRRVDGQKNKKSLQGNLDPCTLYATRETIRKEVSVMLKKFGTQGYIANLGHGMHPTMDPDHAHEFILSVQQESAAMNDAAAAAAAAAQQGGQ